MGKGANPKWKISPLVRNLVTRCWTLMKRIVLLRHTKTAFNSEPIRLRGGLDVPLSREGFAQIPDVTERFKLAYPDVKAVYSSPLERASILAIAIAHEYDLKV